MRYNIKKIIKRSLISLAVLGMIGGSTNTSRINASHRYHNHIRTHRNAHYHVHRNRRRHNYRHNKRNSRANTKHKRHAHLRKHRKHDNTHHARYRKHHTKKRSLTSRHKAYYKAHRHHVWKLYRSDGSYAGSYNNYNDYKRGKRWLAWADGNTSNSNSTTNNSAQNTDQDSTTNTISNGKNTSDNVPNEDADNSSNSRINNNVDKNLAEFKQQTLTDMNNDRQSRGLVPLTETPELDQLANSRAQQIQSNFNHVDGHYSENITETRTGDTRISDGTPINNNNGYDMANNEENAMMNHDGPNWGHRANILKPSHIYVGIGTSYSYNGGSFPYKLVEDFN